MDRLISEKKVLNIINRYGTDELRIKAVKAIPPVEQELRQQIAEQLADKMDYWNTCLNERDSIINIVMNDSSPHDIHCRTDCNNKKCQSHPLYKAIPSKMGHWVETGRMFVELNGNQILYEYTCDNCKVLAYFSKSKDDSMDTRNCPCCNSLMEIER